MMDVQLIARVLALRRTLLRRDRWSRGELEAHQARQLRVLRDFATACSPFYRDRFAGLEQRPLHELPVLTKDELRERFDDLVTDRDVHLGDVVAHIAAESEPGELFRGRYRAAATSGSTGVPGVFLWDEREWATVLASYARPYAWAGLRPGPLHRRRLAVVSSRSPWHQSAVVAASVRSRFVPTLHLDAGAPLAETCAALDAFQPDGLVCYASMAGVLAEAQLEGRMRLRPTAILCASEVLTPAIRRRVAEAFGSEPFDVYGATETATVACECEAHRGLHLFEDLVVSEVVDERDHPVPIGQPGARVLVTVLFARTLPLIRYAMSDAPILQAGACACGRPYALLAGVEGRADETLRLPGKAGGEVAVHPVVFHRVMEAATGHEWQVVREASGLRVDVALAAQVDAAAVAASITAALERAGVAPVPIAVRAVARVERGASGKAARVRSEARPDHPRA